MSTGIRTSNATPLPETIDDVLAELDIIVDRARSDDDRTGFFAVLYRGVTQRVRDDVRAGRFEDPDRMARLDVVFANRYLEALSRYQQNETTSRCWQIAFDAATTREPLILHHLLLGMNAHIHLDLGIAAAQTCPGDAIGGLQRDFNRINAILLGMLDDVQHRLNGVSPWFGLLDRAGGLSDEMVARFSLKTARLSAWMAANRLARLAPDEHPAVVTHLDHRASSLARLMLRPGPLLGLTFRLIRMAERRRPAEIIDALA